MFSNSTGFDGLTVIMEIRICIVVAQFVRLSMKIDVANCGNEGIRIANLHSSYQPNQGHQHETQQDVQVHQKVP